MSRISEWKKELGRHKKLIFISLFFLAISIILDYFSGVYVMEVQGVVAPDLILDHLPTLDLDFIFIYGDVLLIALIFIYPTKIEV